MSQQTETPVQASVATKRTRRQAGFTLIELIVVVTIIGILAGIAIVQVQYAQRKARESALRMDLHEMRKAIDDFYADKQRFPQSLAELKPKYLRDIPKDPITKSADWEEIADVPDPGEAAEGTDPTADQTQAPGISNVKSKAPGVTLDNVPYTDL